MFRSIAWPAGMAPALAALLQALPAAAQQAPEPAGTVQLQSVPNPPQPVATVPALVPPLVSPIAPPTEPPSDVSGGYGAPSGYGNAEAGMSAVPHASPLPPPAAKPQTALQARTENGVSYLCGGIGQEEAEEMKQRAQDYGLMLTFAARNGSYLANVHVEIDDAKGRPVLKTTCDAPMMLVNLPQAGNYRVRAEAGGYTVTRMVGNSAREQGSGRVRSIVMAWPKQAAGIENGTMSGGGAAPVQSGTR